MRQFVRAGDLPAHLVPPPPPPPQPSVDVNFSGSGVLSAVTSGQQSQGNGNQDTVTPTLRGSGTLTAVTSGANNNNNGGNGTPMDFSATDLFNSISVNTHWENSSWQGQTSMLQSRILELGVPLYRGQVASNPSAARANLANAGLKMTGVLGSFCSGFIRDLNTAIAAAKKMPHNIAYLEGPNEPDNPGVGCGATGWQTNTQNWMKSMYSAIRGDAYFNGIPVTSPSIADPSKISSLGSEPYQDYINMHTYYWHGHPEDMSGNSHTLGSWITASKAVYGSTKPLSITEWGYHTDIGGSAYVDYPTQATYTVRGLLWHRLNKVVYTSIYELWDDPGASSAHEQSFGLIHQDGSPKPAFTAVKNLLSRVKDTGTGTLITNFPYKYSTSGTDVQVIGIGRKDGTVDFAVWRKATIWNYPGAVSVSPVQVDFTLGVAKTAVSYRVNDGTTTTLKTNSTTFSVQATADVQLIRIS